MLGLATIVAFLVPLLHDAEDWHAKVTSQATDTSLTPQAIRTGRTSSRRHSVPNLLSWRTESFCVACDQHELDVRYTVIEQRDGGKHAYLVLGACPPVVDQRPQCAGQECCQQAGDSQSAQRHDPAGHAASTSSDDSSDDVEAARLRLFRFVLAGTTCVNNMRMTASHVRLTHCVR